MQPFFESDVDGRGMTTVVGLHQEENPHLLIRTFSFLCFLRFLQK